MKSQGAATEADDLAVNMYKGGSVATGIDFSKVLLEDVGLDDLDDPDLLESLGLPRPEEPTDAM